MIVHTDTWEEDTTAEKTVAWAYDELINFEKYVRKIYDVLRSDHMPYKMRHVIDVEFIENAAFHLAHIARILVKMLAVEA